jgi:1,4-alpha-glucan branching enzyme
LESEAHRKFHLFRKALNEVYLDTRALWERDFEETGFRLLNCHEEEKNIYLFVRKGKKETVLAVFNFSDTAQTQFEVSFDLLKEFMNGIPKKLELLIGSEEERFGGTGELGCTTYAIKNGSVKMDIAVCSGYLFRCR